MDTINYLRERYSPWVWLGQRAHDACGMNRVLPLDMIISCDHGREVSDFFSKDVFSIEAPGSPRKEWSNEDINSSLKDSLGRRVFDRWNGEKKGLRVICYRSVKRLERPPARLKTDARMLASPLRLKEYFDDKVLLYNTLERLALPRIPGMTALPSKYTFGELRDVLGLPFVVQFPFGSSGKYTFIVREEKNYSRVKNLFPDKTAVIRKYIKGYSLNVNAVIITKKGARQTLCSFPSVQLTGIRECCGSESAFCGNDYASAGSLDSSITEQVRQCAERVGDWMAEKGYRGIFGMDFLVKRGKVYPVEINPRFQNSTSLFTSLQAKAGVKEDYLFVLHIAEMLRDGDRVLAEYVESFPGGSLMEPLKGSQLILRNKGALSRVSGEIGPGVYSNGGVFLTYKGRGAFIGEIGSRDYVLVTCGVPSRGTPVEANAPICKLQSLSSMLKSDRRCLNARMAKAVGAVYDKLDMRQEEKVESP